MTQDHATRVPLRPFTVVRASTEAQPAPVPPVPDPSTGPGTEPVPVPAAPVPMPVLAQARLAVSRWLSTAARIAREFWVPCARFLDRVWHPEPETMAQHRTYIRSRQWVAPGITGKWAAVIAWAGILYHAFVAQPVKYAMKAVQKTVLNAEQAADRPLRFLMLTVFVSALILILL